jgi:hypothetical protein
MCSLILVSGGRVVGFHDSFVVFSHGIGILAWLISLPDAHYA